MESGISVATHIKTVEVIGINRDHVLVAAAQAGVASAFTDLRNLYAGRLYRTIYSITKNREDAEDALQDCFLRAFLGLKNFEGRANFYSWLTRIAINSSLMILRKRRTQRESSLCAMQDSGEETTQIDVRDEAPDPECSYEQGQRQAMLLKAIGRLKPTLRRVVEVRMAEECSVKEVASILSISEAAAKSRLYRARLRLNSSTSVKVARGHNEMSAGRGRMAMRHAEQALS